MTTLYGIDLPTNVKPEQTPHGLLGAPIDEAIRCVLGHGGKIIVYEGKDRTVHGRDGDFKVKVKVKGNIIVEVQQDD